MADPLVAAALMSVSVAALEGFLEVHGWIVWSLLALSIVTLVLSVVLIPAFIVRLPADYYRGGDTPGAALGAHGPGRALIAVARNLLGLTLLLAGIAMLVLPGQGLLTILAAFALLRFPGKRALELRVLRAPGVRPLVDWVRARAGRAPLEL